jgi:starch synthase
VYFIDNDDYFSKRQMLMDESGVEYDDNGERAIFFARGVLETVKKLRWIPDIIHCQGWMSAVIPFYIKTAYHDEPSYANTKVVTSLFNKNMNSDLGTDFKKNLEFRDAKEELLNKYNDKFDFEELCKLAIDYSDGIIEAEKDIDVNVQKYAENSNKPLLKFPGEEFADAYESLYDQLSEE